VFRTIGVGLILMAGLSAECQTFSLLQKHDVSWSCRGHVWILSSNQYCWDAINHNVSKVTLTGQQVFSHLPTPTDKPYNIVGLTADSAGQIYAVDGLTVYIYSPQGKYEKSLSPGINLGQGIVVLDSQHIFVAGRSQPGSLQPDSTIFEIGPDGVKRSFSDVFFQGLPAADDMILNKQSFLALDRHRNLLYQLPQTLYEIRVFSLNGELLRKIMPPPNIGFNSPQCAIPWVQIAPRCSRPTCYRVSLFWRMVGWPWKAVNSFRLSKTAT